ncbi:MAG: radical SAM protein [Planctomycetota bacterium]|nr:radical SAM protein [Planctomycetota bacterium]
MGPPRLVFWETTRACNLRCAHCRRIEAVRPEYICEVHRTGRRAGPGEDDRAKGAGGTSGELSREEALALVGAIAETGRPILVLSGGEPLLRPDIFDIAGRAVSLGLTVSLATNGTLVDDAVADRIAASGIRRVAISLDGPDAATHDAFRGEAGSFERAQAGFERLRRRGVSLQINATITRATLGRVEEMYELAARLGADALHVFSLVPVGCGAEIAPGAMLSAAESERLLLWVARKAAEGRLQMKATCAPQYFRIAGIGTTGSRRSHGGGGGDPASEDTAPDGEAAAERTAPGGEAARDNTAPGGMGCDAAGSGAEGTPRGMREAACGGDRAAAPPDPGAFAAGSRRDQLAASTKGCLAGTGVCFISSIGDIFPCGYFPVSCGNVREYPFREIWESSPVFRELRDPDRLKGKCGRCGFRYVCGGCRARAYAIYGDYLAEEPSCAYLPP